MKWQRKTTALFLTLLLSCFVALPAAVSGPGGAVASAATPTEFDGDDYGPEDDGDDHWNWPESDDFEEIFERYDGEIETVRLGVGDLSFELAEGFASSTCPRRNATFHGALFLLREEGATADLWAPIQPGPGGHRGIQIYLQRAGEYRVIRGPDQRVEGASLLYDSDCGTLEIDVDHLSEVTSMGQRDLSALVYTETLLTFGGDLYEKAGDDGNSISPAAIRKALSSGDGDTRRRGVERLMNSDLGPSHQFWAEALELLAEVDDHESARRVHRRYRPVGHCSMDRRPQQVAAQYSEVCRRLGDLGCFLPLRIQIMGNYFARVSNSSVGERAHDPQAGVLATAPIDVDRFLWGLTLGYYTEEGFKNAPLWRIGQALSREFPELSETFLERAEDPSVDELNRLRATIVLYFAATDEGIDGKKDNALLAELSDASLAPAARHWLDATLSSQR